MIPDENSDTTASTLWPSSILLAMFLKINLPINEPQTVLEVTFKNNILKVFSCHSWEQVWV
jgi:hypothetical protein